MSDEEPPINTLEYEIYHARIFAEHLRPQCDDALKVLEEARLKYHAAFDQMDQAEDHLADLLEQQEEDRKAELDE